MIYRHMKSDGLYAFICEAKLEADLSPVIVYQSLEHGTIWVRPRAEFFDGRFKEVRSTQA